METKAQLRKRMKAIRDGIPPELRKSKNEQITNALIKENWYADAKIICVYAAIASEVASDFYGVPVIEKGIQDKHENITRFLVIGQKEPPKAENVEYKTSVVLSLNDRPGALCDMIMPFNRNNINLTRIESRPSRKKAWDYLFFIDFLGHWEDEATRRVFKELEMSLPKIKWLGSYPVK